MMVFLRTLLSLRTALLVLALALMFMSPLPLQLQWLDAELYTLAGGVAGQGVGSQLTKPDWYLAAYQGLWALLLVYLLLLLPRPATLMAILLTVLLLTVLPLLQMGAQMRYSLWLPFGIPIQFTAACSPIILFWAQRRKTWQRLISQRDYALIELAKHKIQSGHLEQALDYLKQCKSNQTVASQGYQIAVQQEQKRAYQDATNTYQWLASFAPKYKDVASKAKDLAADAKPVATESLAATQTMAIAAEPERRPVLGRYRVERELGRGAMGVVYLGVDPKISRRVAIKTLSYNMFDSHELSEVKQRFFREAEAAGRLTHPNIVTVYDVGEEPDLSFIAMDYIPGESLRDHIDSSKLLNIKTVYQLIEQVANALDYAHQQNIVHRDIKPGNLLFDTDKQQVKVADFGIARIIDNSSTKTGDILGSPIYMSPEQLKGHKVAGASDIYSLGVTFYQLLTGHPPYNGDSIANLAYQIVNKKFKSVRELRPELPASAPRIINKAMAKEAGKRYATAGEMAEALRKALKKDFGIS